MAPYHVVVLSRSVFPLHGYGGLERHVFDLVQHLLARDHRVTLITRPPLTGAAARARASSLSEEAAPALEHERLQIHFAPYRTFPFAGRRGTTVIDRSTAYPLFGERAGRLAASIVARGGVDIVHGLGASVLGYARARARRRPEASAPLIFNPQGLEEFGGTDPRWGGSQFKRLGYLPLQRAVRACARAADRVIATDRSLEPVVRRILGTAQDRVVVVPNAIDLDRCDTPPSAGAVARVAAVRNTTGEAPVLLSASRLEHNKGFHVLAAALGGIRNLSWRWVVVGDGPYRAQIERAIDAAGIRERTTLLGRIGDDDLRAWYEAASVFVHPTLYEGSSLVTLEAMAQRRAVVGTRAGGLPDKIVPGRNGWLVDAGAVDALAIALRDALSDYARLVRMGLESRIIVEREFAWPAVAARLIDVYADAIESAAPRR